MQLIIDRLTMNYTPQTGTWLLWMKVVCGDHSSIFHIPNKEYEGDRIDIHPMIAVEIPLLGTNCSLDMHLDDDEASVVSDRASDKLIRPEEFAASLVGSQRCVTTNKKNEGWGFDF
jgi:hypothetical protein